MPKKINFIKNIYLSSLGVLFLLFIAAPRLAMADNFTQVYGSLTETAALVILAGAGFWIYRLYRKELKKSQNSLKDFASYAGSVNVQIDQIKSVFRDIKKYPGSKREFKNILKLLADRILAIVNAEWVVLRITEFNSVKILTECAKTRGTVIPPSKRISNKELFEGKIANFTVIKSGQETFNLEIFCILSAKTISQEQKIFIGKIINDLGMLYLIASSVQHRSGQELNYHTSALSRG